MINIAILLMVFVFMFSVSGFVVWSFRDTRKRNTRQEFYDDFLKRKSEREKLRLPR